MTPTRGPEGYCNDAFAWHRMLAMTLRGEALEAGLCNDAFAWHRMLLQ